jgi:hypothetical protein
MSILNIFEDIDKLHFTLHFKAIRFSKNMINIKIRYVNKHVAILIQHTSDIKMKGKIIECYFMSI